jgi:hypothetical protein
VHVPGSRGGAWRAKVARTDGRLKKPELKGTEPVIMRGFLPKSMTNNSEFYGLK